MNPDDVAAILARYGNPHSGDIRALCDALEAAWAGRAEAQEADAAATSLLMKERDRAERAEAKASVTTEALRYLGARADVMAAALARVRAQLCDPGLDPIWDCTCCRDIRAAIEGDDQ